VPAVTLHAHLLLVGFLLLLVFGVAFWMFPRVAGARPGREGGWLAFALLNAGLLLRLLAEPFAVRDGSAAAWDALLGVAAVLPAAAAVAFAVAIWPRVRGVSLSPTRRGGGG
jgi:heme/copper-type cytochrome/quinol oxidase subunit 1